VPGPTKIERVEVPVYVQVPIVPWKPLGALLAASVVVCGMAGWWIHRTAMPAFVCADQPVLYTNKAFLCTARER
jgi:hypothetical protein